MPRVRFGHLAFDVGLVAFDKDGTLIDFESMWGRIARTWAECIAPGPDGDGIRREILQWWGYDAKAGRTLPESPLAIASNSQLMAIAAATLYRHGTPWSEAEERARAALQATLAKPEMQMRNLLRPIGDVVGLMSRLSSAGVRLAVITTDDRPSTLEALRLLGIGHLVEEVVCADDGLPVKPAPDMLLAACSHLGIAPQQAAVVGDSEGDLVMAQRAGARLKVGVLSGTGDRASLERLADLVLASIDEIDVPDAALPGSQ